MKRILVVIVFMLGFSEVLSAKAIMVDPPIIATSQLLCDGDGLGNVAVGQGNNFAYSINRPDVIWYDSSAFGNVIDKYTPIETGIVYYGAKTANADGTGEESVTRSAISFTFVVAEQDTTSDPMVIFLSANPAIFSYDLTEICNGGTTSFLDSSNSLGNFSASRVSPGTGTLSMNLNTGTINVPNSDAGIYDVTHTVFFPCFSSYTQQITVFDPTVPNADFSYFSEDSFSYCHVDNSDPNNPVYAQDLVPTITGDLGGTFNSTPGLAIDPVTGVIDISESIPSDLQYRITYTVSKPCGGSNSTAKIVREVKLLEYKQADFTYGGNTFCKSDATLVPEVTSGARGSYSATNGVVFLPSFPGVIDLESTPAGTYTVTYTTTNACHEESHDETITIAENSSTSFSYNLFYCEGDPDPTPQGSFSEGGTFTVNQGGLNIDANTGIINLSGSTAGVYTISYTLSGSGQCVAEPSSQIVNINIVEPTTDSVQEFCVADGTPTLTSLVGSSSHEVRWYDSMSATTSLSPILDPELVSQTYYVTSYSAQCDSESARIPVAVFVYGSNYELTTETNIDNAGFIPSSNAITASYGQSLALQIPENFAGTVSWTGPNGFTSSGKTITISNALNILHQGTYTATASFDSCSEMATMDFVLKIKGDPGVLVAPKVYLQGAMLSSNEAPLMRDDLRSLGYLPTATPYEDNVTVTASRFDMQPNPADNIVDWIWVELRDASDPTLVVAGQSALLQRDGDILSVLGADNVIFALPPAEYYVAIKHRNHLSIMSDSAISLSGTAQIINFIDGTTITHGTHAQTDIGMPSGTLGMWAGDTNDDGKLFYTSGISDRFTVYTDILSAVGNTGFDSRYVKHEGYFNTDINMDGNSLYAGSGGDRFALYINVISYPENVLFSMNYALIEEKLPN